MKVAVPTKNGEIFFSFTQSTEFTIYHTENAQVCFRETVQLPPETNDASTFLLTQGTNVLICAEIDSPNKNALRSGFIEMVTGVMGRADEILVRYLSGEHLTRVDRYGFAK